MLLLAICNAFFVEFSENINHVVFNRFFSHIVHLPPPNEHEEAEERELRKTWEARKQSFVHFVDNLCKRGKHFVYFNHACHISIPSFVVLLQKTDLIVVLADHFEDQFTVERKSFKQVGEQGSQARFAVWSS